MSLPSKHSCEVSNNPVSHYVGPSFKSRLGYPTRKSLSYSFYENDQIFSKLPKTASIHVLHIQYPPIILHIDAI
jgi:hypothetical protein